MNWLEITLQLMLLFVPLLKSSSSDLPMALPGCPEKCGEISIPYPFGIGPDCYLENRFEILCPAPNRPLVWGGSLPVRSVSIEYGQLRVLMNASYDCVYNGSHKFTRSVKTSLWSSPFVLSDTKNKLTVVGCHGSGLLKEQNTEGSITEDYIIKCKTECIQKNMTNGSCEGQGCCRAEIPKHSNDFSITATKLSSPPRLERDSGRCTFAFLVEDGEYEFKTSDALTLLTESMYPVVLDWWVGRNQFDNAKRGNDSFASKSENSVCSEPNLEMGYRCNCTDGYEGNPYIPNGCKDIDECKNPTENSCVPTANCINNEGNYKCVCPHGYRGDGKTNGSHCSTDQSIWIKILIGIIISLSLSFLAISWIYLATRQRKKNKMREKFFNQNGGVLFKQRLSKLQGSNQQTLLFSEEDLKKATANYHVSRILGQGGQGTVYKGLLPENQTLAIKKAKINGDSTCVDQFINELVVLSQINHRNVVKLLGCCLETEVPLLVYEFVTNGALYDHLHDPCRPFPLPWDVRLKVAVEIAGALSYLHSAASIPIIHRDIKSANILLDDRFTAKVSDFGASRMVPMDQEQLTTLVQGTMGYLDPEYFQTGHLNEKSDVYSFGVVLLELVTGKRALSYGHRETERHLVPKFLLAMKEDRWVEIFDQRVLSSTNTEQLMEVADIAMRCVKLKGEERPTMKEVAMELEGLKYRYL